MQGNSFNVNFVKSMLNYIRKYCTFVTNIPTLTKISIINGLLLIKVTVYNSSLDIVPMEVTTLGNT